MAVLAAPFDLADSVQLGSGIWRIGKFTSYTTGLGTTLVPAGLRDFGEIETGDIALDPGTPTNFRSKRSNDRPIRKTTPGESTITLTLASFSSNFDNLSLFFGGDVVSVTQGTTPVVGHLLMGIAQNRFYPLGITDANKVGIRGIAPTPVVTSAPAALTAWATGVAKAKWAAVGPATPDDKVLIALNAGTTHATTEPTWPTVIGDTVVDNDITWLLTATASTTFTENVDYVVDNDTETGARIRWDSAPSAIAVFVDYTPTAATWNQIPGGQSISYDGYAEFHGDVEGAEQVLMFPRITLQSNGTLPTVTDQTTFVQVGLTGTVITLENLAPFYWASKPV